VVILGGSSGPADPIVPKALIGKSIHVLGGNLVNFITTREDLLCRSKDVLYAIEEGCLKLLIDRVLPLAEADKAYQMLENRQSMGKIVLKVVDL